MSQFQVGEVPPGFSFTENEVFIGYKNALVLAVPQANQVNAWGDLWLSLGSGWADAQLVVNYHTDAGWSTVETWEVNQGGPRVFKKLPAGTQKIAIGRRKKNANDTEDDIPVSWLLEYFDR